MAPIHTAPVDTDHDELRAKSASLLPGQEVGGSLTEFGDHAPYYDDSFVFADTYDEDDDTGLLQGGYSLEKDSDRQPGQEVGSNPSE